MRTIFCSLIPKNMVPLLFLLLILFPLPVNAQLEPAPHPLDTFLTVAIGLDPGGDGSVGGGGTVTHGTLVTPTAPGGI